MGVGADVLAHDEELHRLLREAGWAPTVEAVGAADPAAGEVARTFELLRALADQVARAVARGAFPLVCAGGCLSASGTVAGVGADGIGVVWLDAHADLDDPEDNVSGFLDVMALSLLTGACWRAQRETIPHFAAVPEDRVSLIGARDLAPYQRAKLERSAVHTGGLGELGPRTYLHIDLDVLDTSEGRANHHAAPGGPSLAEVLALVDDVFAWSTVVGAALTAYDPSADRDDRILAAARTIAARIAARAAAQR
jgi:arginase